MNKLTKIVTLAVLALGSVLVQAEKVIPGPKGGRLLENEPPRAEFFVERDRTVTITFYDKDLKPVPVANQSVTLIAEPKSGKATIDCEKKGDALVSKSPLPAGDPYNVVVQLKMAADAKPKNFRLALNLETCGECKRAEYACICGH